MGAFVKCLLMGAVYALFLRRYHVRYAYIIPYPPDMLSLRGMRTRRIGVLAPFGRLPLGAGIISAMRILYHILRIWQPPAELSARLSAVDAETGMRRYNVRSYGHYTIWAESGGDRLGIDKRKGPDFQFFPENRAVKI